MNFFTYSIGNLLSITSHSSNYDAKTVSLTRSLNSSLPFKIPILQANISLLLFYCNILEHYFNQILLHMPQQQRQEDFVKKLSQTETRLEEYSRG